MKVGYKGVFITWACFPDVIISTFSYFFSWQVYRCQTIDRASVKAREPQRDTKPKPAADDWGIADTDDWGTGCADDWGTEAADRDDWGIEGSIDKTTGFGDIERTMTDGVRYKYENVPMQYTEIFFSCKT